MISKKIYVLIFAFVYSFAFSCSSGDDEIDQNTEIPEESPNNTHTNNPQKPDDISESTDYIVTDEIKTITLDSKSKQEYLIYKDYYWKHKIYLDGTNICFNSYYGGGEGWNLRNYGPIYYQQYYVGIRDRGEFTKLSEIPTNTIYFDHVNLPYYEFKPNDTRKVSIQFKPNHGYEVAYIVDTGYKLRHMRVYPTKYTLNSNDVLTSVTIEYQSYP